MIKKTLLGVLIGLLAICACAQAETITLTDSFGPNSTVTLDPSSATGVSSWLVDGNSQMSQNSFWYRIGSTGVARPVSSLGTLTVSHNADFAAVVLYSGLDFDVQITYSLMGADRGAGSSDLAQTVLVTNKTDNALDLHLFEFGNMNLNGTAANETGVMTDPSTFLQSDGSTTGQLGVNLIPDAWEIGDAAAILNKINTNDGLTLGNATSPYIGDAGFAFQWNMNLGKGASASISQDSLIQYAQVPECSSILVIVSGLGALGLFRKRRA